VRHDEISSYVPVSMMDILASGLFLSAYAAMESTFFCILVYIFYSIARWILLKFAFRFQFPGSLRQVVVYALCGYQHSCFSNRFSIRLQPLTRVFNSHVNKPKYTLQAQILVLRTLDDACCVASMFIVGSVP
jgi:hypothetical protein